MTSTNWSSVSTNSTNFTPASSVSTEYLPEQVTDTYNMSDTDYNDSDTYYSGHADTTPPLSTDWTNT